MLLRVEIVIPIYCENNTKHIDALRGQTAEFVMLKQLAQLLTAGLWNVDDKNDCDLAEGLAECLRLKINISRYLRKLARIHVRHTC
jgi:hypothetical protein